ncbi:MAG TPA: hypothetical protein VGG20_15650 [Thermoanaerobaculia bacterium]
MNVPECGPKLPPSTTGDREPQGKPAQHVHPSPEQLERFLRGELGRSECRRIVRHLLTGCSTCVALTAPIFRLAEAPLVRENT